MVFHIPCHVTRQQEVFMCNLVQFNIVCFLNFHNLIKVVVCFLKEQIDSGFSAAFTEPCCSRTIQQNKWQTALKCCSILNHFLIRCTVLVTSSFANCYVMPRAKGFITQYINPDYITAWYLNSQMTYYLTWAPYK